MTYKEAYSKARSLDHLKSMVKHDTIIAIVLGNNPDRIKAIEQAMNEITQERGW
jgi:hypothetical protein